MAVTISGDITAIVGDTLTPWSFFIEDLNGTVPDLDDYDSVEFHALDDSACPATDLVAWTSSNVTVQPTKTFTSDTATGIKSLYSVNHGLKVGMQLKLSTTTTLPTGLNNTQRFFVVRVNGHNFWVCKQRTGTPIEITDSGTGTHSFEILGHVQYQPQAGDVTTAGTYKAEIRIEESGKYETLPGDASKIPLYIVQDACD